MSTPISRGTIVSDANLETLAGYLAHDDAEPRVECAVAPYGQVARSLLDETAAGGPPPDWMLVWTRPEGVLPSVGQLLEGAEVSLEALHHDVDALCAQLAVAAGRVRTLFVPTWTVPGFHVGHGVLDLAPRVGVARALLQANLRLLEGLDRLPNAVPLSAAKWVEAAGDKAFNPRLWYLAKVPFGHDVLKMAARDVKAALRGLGGRARKLVVLDLDDVLWGGIVGEVGWPSLVLGGPDPLGEALVDFQRELRALTRRGVVLAIASKNEEAVALEAIARHPEMVLRPDDFAAWRINWKDKAENIAELAAEINVGLDAVVFIDDSAIERGRVREALPQVLVPDWPGDQRLYPDALRRLDCFDTPSISEEDRQRPRMYAVERRRTALRAEVGSLDEWLRTLDLTLTVGGPTPANLSRVTQLLNKTNQMNLSSRRMTPPELAAWTSAADHRAWVFHVADRFGDAGLTGLLTLAVEGPRATIVDFVVSCRVMGRRVEEAMLHVAIEWARSAGLREVRAVHAATAKNGPCREFLLGSGLSGGHDGTFVWDASLAYPLPPGVRLVGEADGA